MDRPDDVILKPANHLTIWITKLTELNIKKHYGWLMRLKLVGNIS